MKDPIQFGAMVLAVALVFDLSETRVWAQPLAWNKEASRKYLEQRVTEWLDWDRSARGEGTRCISCHTAVPLALAGFTLDKASNAEARLIANVKTRVAKWDRIASWNDGESDKIQPFYGGVRKTASRATEAVLNALILVNHDRTRKDGQLGDDAQKALAILWTRQNEKGFWEWLDFGLQPWETDAHYFGAALAAGAIGKAGPKYYETGLNGPEKAQLERLRKFLKANYESQPLHHRLWALWASTLLPGLLNADQQKKITEEVLNLDKEKGSAWNISTLGTKPGLAKWKTAKAIPAEAKHDGYATALIVYILKQARTGADSSRMKKAAAWLVEQKVAEGQGPVFYLNRAMNPNATNPNEAMVGKFMRDAAAGYAVLALMD